MKTKLIIVSMSVLGLIAAPTAFANHKHKKHTQQVQQEYKGEYKGEVQPVETVVVVNPAIITYQTMSQNLGRAMPMPEWYNRVGISGGINIDALKFGTTNAHFQGVNYQRLSLNDIYLNAAASVNDWTKGFASLSFSNPSQPTGVPGVSPRDQFGQYSDVYAANQLTVEQAYLTVANFDVSPLFFQIGKQFQDFSRYQIHPITRSTTQVMSESLQTSAKAGFIFPWGLNGSLYAFDNQINQINQSSGSVNWGASLGWEKPGDQFGYNLGIGYLNNLIGANDVGYAASSNNPNPGGVYEHGVGGVALYAGINGGPFSLSGTFTTATQSFSPLDVPTNTSLTTGAKPWAAAIQAGYGFMYWNKGQNIYVGYQASKEAGYLYLPSSRWQVGYNIDFWRNTDLTFEYDHDNDYSVSNGGQGDSANLFSLRAGVKFG